MEKSFFFWRITAEATVFQKLYGISEPGVEQQPELTPPA